MRRGAPGFAAWGLVLLALAAACSRRALSDDAGGTGHVGADGGLEAGATTGIDAVRADGGRDASADGAIADGDSGAIPCGAITCTGTDLCVEILGCGGPLNCMGEIDAGVCPSGSTYNTNCLSVTGRACAPDCPPPSYICAPRPAACTGTPDCNCLASFCRIGSCLGVQGRLVECGAV